MTWDTSPDQDRRPIGELLEEAEKALYSLNPADTAAALQTAWYAFHLAGAAGQILSVCADPSAYPPLWDNAEPVCSAAVRTLAAAPSLKTKTRIEANPAGSPDDRLGDQAAEQIRRRILDVALAINTALPTAATHARTASDRSACREGAKLASELADVYEGRLRSFLNPGRSAFGPSGIRIGGQVTPPALGPRRRGGES